MSPEYGEYVDTGPTVEVEESNDYFFSEDVKVFRLIRSPGLKDLGKLINVDFFSLGSEFDVVFCIKVGISLY